MSRSCTRIGGMRNDASNMRRADVTKRRGNPRIDSEHVSYVCNRNVPVFSRPYAFFHIVLSYLWIHLCCTNESRSCARDSIDSKFGSSSDIFNSLKLIIKLLLLINQWYKYGIRIEKFLSYISSNPRKIAKSIFHFSPPYLVKLDRNREYVIRRSPINPSKLLNLRKNNWANIISLKEKKKRRIGRRKLIEISIS